MYNISILKNAVLFLMLNSVFSDCMEMSLNCISGPLLPTICTVYPRKNLQNQQMQLSFKNSWLIHWIYAMTYYVKVITFRYSKELQIMQGKALRRIFHFYCKHTTLN